MKQLVTEAIVLSRTYYGEADRILTMLTPEHGKVRLMARGVRRVKSKLAGGIELFSVSSITFAPGRGEIGTLISARLETHYSQIVTDVERTMAGYEFIRLLHKITEDQVESAYFELLQQAFAALDSEKNTMLVKLWFSAQLLRLGGHTPNLFTDTNGQKLDAQQLYTFDTDHMAFAPSINGRFGAKHIKFMRLLFDKQTPNALAAVQGGPELAAQLAPLITTMRQSAFRV